MARGVQLTQLLDDLRAETGRDSSVAAGRNELHSLKKRLAREQNKLYQAYDWPFLRVQQTIALQAGERHYDWPALLNKERVEKIRVLWNSSWYDTVRGITEADYNSYNSLADERSDPVLKWDIRSTGATLAAQAEQVEVWPLPASNDPVLHLWGLRPLKPLIADEDVCDIDSDLIVLSLASKMLARQKSADAGAVLKDFQKLWSHLTGNSQGGGGNINMTGGGLPKKFVGTIIRVA